MNNYLNEKRSYGVIIAAILSSLVIMITGMATGMVYAVRAHRQSDAADNEIAGYLLESSAYDLRHSMSALRLCTEDEPAEKVARTALVHAVRAETALECHMDDWADSRAREAFLNDVATILHSYSPSEAIKLADKLYEFSSKFYDSVVEGGEFEYGGELIPGQKPEESEQPSEDDIAAAQALVKKVLETDKTEYVGAWGGHIEFNLERDGVSGYAVVCGDKIFEFSFMRPDGGKKTEIEEAKRIALASAEECGYPGLEVEWIKDLGRSVGVIMCKSYSGFAACDDYATAVVYDGKTVAFTAGKCDAEHKNIPEVKVGETTARRAVPDSSAAGRPVVRTVDGRERVCYEYRFDLDDGTHYVYVCAETGKQMEVK